LATPAQEDACFLHLYYIMVFVSVNVLLMVLLMTFISGLFRKTDLTLEQQLSLCIAIFPRYYMKRKEFIEDQIL